MYTSNKASTFIYILLLVNITLIMGVVVYNNSFILNNNINIGRNSEEVYSHIYNKGDINIQSIKDFNSNGNGYVDTISCPTNVTMSGVTNRNTGITTEYVFNKGSIYCRGYYGSSIPAHEFRIYFSPDNSTYEKAYYDGDTVDLVVASGSSIGLGSDLVNAGTYVDVSSTSGGYDKDNIHDNNYNSEYRSNKKKPSWIMIDFGSKKALGFIKIRKDSNWGGGYWDRGEIRFYAGANGTNEIANSKVSISGIRNDSLYEVDLKNAGLIEANKVRSVKIISTKKKYLDLKEVEIFELLVTNSGGDYWVGDREFNDSDNTLISFDETGTTGGDGIDDNFNSDDYKATSSGTYYFDSFEDDDVIPRKIIFGNISAGKEYQNIFWNNFKTAAFIDGNTNNNDTINVKIGDINNGYFYLDIFNEPNTLYDLKILEFDHNEYKDNHTLLAKKSYTGIGLTSTNGYIQVNGSGNLSLSPTKTGNEFEFDWQNIDYALFLTNKTDTNLAYRLNGETQTGTGIYINPIDDSYDDIIKSMSNDIIIGGEKNFIGDTFIVVGDK